MVKKMEIKLENMSFQYSPSVKVLNDINLTLDSPGLVCIIGPNGVGKSTLIKCINKLLKPTSGDVFINGKNIKEYNLKELAKRIGYVAATHEECFSMSVLDSILIGRYNHRKWRTNDEDLEIARKVMKLLQIENLSTRSHNELSAGQYQKVAIARGLVQETEILILDEPTSNLDVKHQVYVTEMLRAISIVENKLIIMISHDLNISAKYAHKIVVMSKPGQIYDIGTPEEVISKEMVQNVYGVDCKIVYDDVRPHVMLGFAMEDE